MPIYNANPVYLRQAIESVLNQTLEDWELVIVEDPSPRPATEVLKDYPDPRIRHLVNPNRTSLVEQRNRCLTNARAELVACLDADDIAKKDRLEKQVIFMQTHPDIAVLGTQLAVIDGDGKLLGYRFYPYDHETIIAAMHQYNPIGNPSVMFRKSLALEVGGYRYDRYPKLEDYDLWCRLAKRGARFANLPEFLTCYRVHQENMSAKVRGTLLGTIEIKLRYWRAEMDFWAKMRLLAERFLLLLPSKWVVWLFLKTQLCPSLERKSREQ